MSMKNREIYLSVDIEADGPIPGPCSMLSLGAAMYLPDATLLGTFSANLETLPFATGEADTMEWWKKQPEAWEACRKDLQDPAVAMKNFADWINSIPGRPVFVGYPASYDFLFTYWYLRFFGFESPFSFSALDIRTYAMATLRSSFKETTKKTMPRRWFDGLPKHNHVAVDDAIEQGALFCNMLAESRFEGPTTGLDKLLEQAWEETMKAPAKTTLGDLLEAFNEVRHNRDRGLGARQQAIKLAGLAMRMALGETDHIAPSVEGRDDLRLRGNRCQLRLVDSKLPETHPDAWTTVVVDTAARESARCTGRGVIAGIDVLLFKDDSGRIWAESVRGRAWTDEVGAPSNEDPEQVRVREGT